LREPTVEQWPQARLGWNKGRGELTALLPDKKAFSAAGQGRALFDRLSEETRKKLDKGKAAFAGVTVKAEGRNWLIVLIGEPPA